MSAPGTGGERFDLVVIGGGSGGLSVASVAGRLGLRVALVEASGELGGECLHTGCVPSKALLRSARVARLMRRGADFGLEACEPAPDMGAVSRRVHAVVDRLQAHDDPDRFRSYGVEVIFAAARFLDAHRIAAGDRVLWGRRFVLATGSTPAVPEVPGLAAAGYWTNENLFDVTEPAGELAVVGGGPVGVEMAQAFRRLGWTVTLVQRGARLLPAEDGGASGVLREALEAEGLTIHTGNKLQEVVPAATRDERHALRLADGSEIPAQRILVATGRHPTTGGLDLEAAGVERTETGAVAVDRRQRTTARHIYAVGDVCGPYQYSHLANYQAGVVIQNAVFRLPARADLTALPRVTFCDPEVAQVGLTAAEAEQRYGDTEVHRADFADLDRALAEGEATGFAKLVFRRGRIIGATVVGPHAGELLPQLVQAVRGKLRPKDIIGAVHAYPTLAEIAKRAVEKYYGERLFRPPVKGLVRWINRLVP
ncbi:dihydrolipoyl dehydrogenase family protein [Thiohalorhabdus methylotrophus]|uniref:NAD(P)/FAD-dependent oxidoreductase n=1 Tax=Thiohalorhabdus methylotrophus TaxID=3242694 RepID=A0ABV4TSK7_9GAMM